MHLHVLFEEGGNKREWANIENMFCYNVAKGSGVICASTKLYKKLALSMKSHRLSIVIE